MREDLRPNPDALLAEVNESERKLGRLKIFLGMCPGVGKTYAMLLAAQQRQEDGIKIAVGYIETHGRIETTALTTGILHVPFRKIEHRGMQLTEMDLDAILTIKPALVLVDELAHSNVAGSRHPKRWQDVTELLEAGIDVYTTLNVQHIESCRDVVAQITGAPARETVPDSLIDLADEIELIDVSPRELRKRLDEGKVYLGDRAAAASENFFREGNLKALREIALRVTAERADKELREFMRSRSIPGPWRSRERYLVAVGPSPFSDYLVRWTRRICALTHGTWMAVYIDSGRVLPDEERARLEKNLSLARSLGAEVLTAASEDVTETLLRVAHEHNITQLVVGKPLSHPWLDFARGGSLVDKLIRRSGDIDVYVVRAEKSETRWRLNFAAGERRGFFREVGFGLLMVLGTTLVGLLLRQSIGYMAVGLIYLLAVMLSSMFLSRWPTLIVAAITALAWNFLFITPYYTFYISNIHDVILFGTYFVVALVMGNLTTRLRQREGVERRREEQATALYQFSKDIVASTSLEAAIKEGARHINELFAVTSTILLEDEEGSLNSFVGPPLTANEHAVAAWCFAKKESAGRFTNTLPQAEGIYLPLKVGSRAVGVLGLKVREAPTLPERQLIETFAAQIALLIERERFVRQAEAAKVEERSRHLQKTLLDSVSHEFKTPLAVIGTAVESLDAGAANASLLVSEIRIATGRLNRVVSNLLDITRIETGAIHPKNTWCDLRELIEDAVLRVREETGDCKITIEVADNVSACLVDAGLVEEMLANLVRNAAQQSPPESTIAIFATGSSSELLLRILDEGPGLEEQGTRVFEKFYRGKSARSTGLGLGLSIVKGFAEALGGSVNAGPRGDGKPGAEFQIRLPVETKAADTILPAT